MGKYIKKRKRQARIKVILFCILLLTGIIVLVSTVRKHNPTAPKPEEQLVGIEAMAKKAWSEAYGMGKRSKTELETYIKSYLEKNSIEVEKYYLSADKRGVTITKKPNALLVEPGYYKAGTNYTELVKSWADLKKENIIRIQNFELVQIKELGELVDIVIDDSVTKIGNRVFNKKEKINAVIIPDSVKELGKEVFTDSAIKEIIVGNGITEFNRTFENMKQLEKLQFTDSIVKISDYTFKDTQNLKEIFYIGNEYSFCNIINEEGDGIITWNCPAKLYLNGVEAKEFVVPSEVKIINNFLLYNYTNITSIVIPNTVEMIGILSLASPSIKNITYLGTMKQWEAIRKNEGWNSGLSEYTIYCSDGEIEK